MCVLIAAIGATARIGRTPARLHSRGSGLVEASDYPVAERGPRRWPIIIAQRRIHLRHPGWLDPGRWRRRRWRRVELRSAGQAVRQLRESCLARGQRPHQRRQSLDRDVEHWQRLVMTEPARPECHKLVAAAQRIAGNGMGDTRCKVRGMQTADKAAMAMERSLRIPGGNYLAIAA